MSEPSGPLLWRGPAAVTSVNNFRKSFLAPSLEHPGLGTCLSQTKQSPAPFQKLQASDLIYALAVLEDGGLAAGNYAGLLYGAVDLFNASALEPQGPTGDCF